MSRNSDLKYPAIATAAAVTGVAALVAASVWWYWASSSSTSGADDGDSGCKGDKEGKSTSHVVGSGSGATIPSGLRADTASKQQVLEILRKVSASQEEMRTVMRTLTTAVFDKMQQQSPEQGASVNFLDVYKQVQGVIPTDPLDAAEIPMTEFDKMLDKYSTDDDVRYALEQIMGLPAPGGASAAVAATPDLTKDDVIKIHEFMLQQLRKVVAQVKVVEQNNTSSGEEPQQQLDVRCTTVSAQVIVSAEVMKQFGVASEAVENAVLEHQFDLTVSPEFTRLNMEMQSAMSDLVGNWPVPTTAK